MTTKATVRHGPPSPSVRAPASPGLLHRKCSCGATNTGGACSKCQGDGSQGVHAPLVQPKLTISQPDDIHEREADRVAAEIMTMSLPTSHRYAQGQAAPQMSPDLSAQVGALRGGGTPLSREARAFMEPRFGYDFSRVRVHTGPRAAQAAQSLNARAFTVGHDIAFGSGEYSPGTDAGRRLLAHELTHVVQQGQAHVHADDRASRAVQHEPTRAVTGTAPPVRKGEGTVDDILATRELVVQRQQTAASLKECKEWRYKELTDNPIAHVRGQQYAPGGIDGRTFNPIPGKIYDIPVYEYVWTVHRYRVYYTIDCPRFEPNAKREGELIGYYYRDSLTGNLVSWKNSKPWEFAYTKEYRRLRDRKQ